MTMADQLTREFVNIQSACSTLGVSRRTVYHWLADGKLPFQRTPGGSIRIKASDLLRPGSTSEFGLKAKVS